MEIHTAIRRYCDYQERSQQEVRCKLFQLGVSAKVLNEIIADLIEEDRLNEERFAMSYVRGKFKIKRWGRVKLKHQLKRHQISEYLIKKALSQIDLNEYFGSAYRLGNMLYDRLSVGEPNIATLHSKIFRYLLQKGYESTIILEVLSVLKMEKFT